MEASLMKNLPIKRFFAEYPAHHYRSLFSKLEQDYDTSVKRRPIISPNRNMHAPINYDYVSKPKQVLVKKSESPPKQRTRQPIISPTRGYNFDPNAFRTRTSRILMD